MSVSSILIVYSNGYQHRSEILRMKQIFYGIRSNNAVARTSKISKSFASDGKIHNKLLPYTYGISPSNSKEKDALLFA